jgi:imidazolonepropionase-like amidohydrolase
MRVLAIAALAAVTVPLAAQQPTALSGATLIDGTGGPVVPDAVVVIENGRIACAGPPAACETPAGARIVDVSGKWIIPGLVDMHVHFGQSGWVDARYDVLDLRAQHPYEQVAADLAANPDRFFRSYLCSGITSVFDPGGFRWSLDLQARTDTSDSLPTVRATGPLLSTIGFQIGVPGDPQMIPMTDEATVRQTVREHAAGGAAAIKVWYILAPEPWYMPPEPPDTARLSALVHAAGDEARLAGLPFVVHARGLWQAKDALRAGAHLLVHSVSFQPVDEEFLQLARETGVYYTPTLTVGDGYAQIANRRFERDRQPFACVDPATRAKALATDTVALEQRSIEQAEGVTAGVAAALAVASDNLLRVHDAGITVVMGTDAGNPLTLHGASVFMELEAMAEAGLSPMDVLVAATRNGARAMGLEDTGTLSSGMVADLVVLDADPLVTIANVRRIAVVGRRGWLYTRAELEYPQ